MTEKKQEIKQEPNLSKEKKAAKQKKSSDKENKQKEELLEGISIEEAFEKLNQIIGSLDREDLPLEDSFRMYQEGVRLLQYCNAKVDMVEKQMIVLNGAENQDEF